MGLFDSFSDVLKVAAPIACGRLRTTASTLQTTVGSAGGASELPTTPTGYHKLYGDDGAVLGVVPYYDES